MAISVNRTHRMGACAVRGAAASRRTADASSGAERRECPTCGKDVLVVVGKPGRPREKHADCRRLDHLLSEAEKLLGRIPMRMPKANDIRHQLRRMHLSLNDCEKRGEG